MVSRQACSGNVLDGKPDPGLQLIAADAVAVMRAAWSAITIQLDAVLIGRASYGMPA